MIKMQINSTATKQMTAIINKIDSFPNRIASAQQSSLSRSQRTLAKKISAQYPAGKYFRFEIQPSGNLGYKMTMTPSVSQSSRDFIKAAVFLKGRTDYYVTPNGEAGSLMKLRAKSARPAGPYPPYLHVAYIPKMKGHEEAVKKDIKEVILYDLKVVLARFGFGPKGGSTDLPDLKAVRSRAK